MRYNIIPYDKLIIFNIYSLKNPVKERPNVQKDAHIDLHSHPIN